MPMQRDRYPVDWDAISLRIREREGWRCKWCGVANGTTLEGRRGPYRVVLTVAHLGAPRADGSKGDPHDKMDVRECNLAALCNACHLRYDAPEHRKTAAHNRWQRKIDAGQEELFPLEAQG